MTRERRDNKGFSLVETIVSSIILSGAVLAVGAIGTRSMVETRLNRQYETAAALIDKQLALIDYMGIDEFIEQGETEGVFADYEPGYNWEVQTEYQDIDNLYLVRIKMSWVERKRIYDLTVDTMLDGEGTYTDTGSQEEETSQ